MLIISSNGWVSVKRKYHVDWSESANVVLEIRKTLPQAQQSHPTTLSYEFQITADEAGQVICARN